MRDPIILLVHLIATLARLMGPGGLRSVVAESVLVKQQLLILNRSRHRAPNLCASDRILAGVCALFMRPARVIRSAIVLRPSTILEFHRALRTRKYRWLFSPKRRRTGPQGPSKALVDAIVDMKRHNPRWGCPRIAQQIALAFAVDIDKDVVNRTGFLGDLIAWEDGVYGTSKSVFSGSARTCRPDGRGAPGGPRLRVGGAAVGGAEARLHGGDAAEVGAAGGRSVMLGIGRA